MHINGGEIMSYTPFGEMFRILRIKHHEVLSDASKLLGVTSAYVSSVECGKRPVPEEWAEKIVVHYKLKDKEKNQLLQAIEDSKTIIKINLSESSAARRTVALQFQRSFDEMDDETATKILRIIERNKTGGL